ncbi:lytic transglycosylase domain-containing protein [Limnohabitans sp. 103DPR2]|uniref:lytic transglycosylase domain-containing protein n=1 Tax=Limnohabitans sp. 103DPR2 TaxID=1678129 RepID=UPI0006DC25BC|nr:lytic transglycosylase domain-containing protein [Limnohabitans sp. 103DPR2]ALK93161.1 Soluble lytic murein transglycosylase precursor [Limnohabitans sp. 103DPR2]
MQLTQILTSLGASVLIFSFMNTANGQIVTQNKSDDVILEMNQAFKKNDKSQLSRLLPKAKGHALEPWAAYWELRVRLDQASTAEIQEFLTTYAGTYAEDRLRNDWLLQLGRQRDWALIAQEYPRFRMNDDREVRCYALGTDAQLSKPETPAELKKLWYALRESDDGCTTVAEKLHDAKKLESLDIWRKARLAMDNNRPRTAQSALNIESAELGKQAILIHADPQKYLDKRIVAFTRKRKELSVLALIRIANTDPDKAAQLLEKKWGLMLTKEEHNWTWGVIGKQAAQKLQDNAHQYFSKVSRNQDLNDDLLAWKARAALRQGDWKAVATTLDAMEDAKNDATWIYWKARAQLSTATTDAQRTEATAALKSIAGVKGFYEQLALEELGQAISVPVKPAPLTAQEKAAAQQNAGLQRALYALSLGLRPEGNREWNYSTNLHTPGGMSERELLAAADLACSKQVWDRCINTSDRTKTQIDFDQRFPMPLKDTVLRKAKEVQLDPAYVYGLIRQESRFIMDAKSVVGASGLMQVMPATAKWTAKKIGLTNFQVNQLNEHETNVAIGTGYLKLVLDDFDGSMPLAAAAYNAGPSRSRAWRKGPVLEAAIWAENIPFTETRDYVKKVLSNTTNYAVIITGQPQSLKARLGTVGPRNAQAPEENADLP